MPDVDQAANDERARRLNWDTFGLFERLWEERDTLLATAQSLTSANEEDTLEIKLAVVGFSLFAPVEEWSYKHYLIVHNRLQGELSAEESEADQEDALAFARFACLAIGAMLGKYAAGEIDDAGFLLGDAHLVGYMALEGGRIYTFGRTANTQQS